MRPKQIALRLTAESSAAQDLPELLAIIRSVRFIRGPEGILIGLAEEL